MNMQQLFQFVCLKICILQQLLATSERRQIVLSYASLVTSTSVYWVLWC
uniref:Uncharacterized protein n=1 Tax=Arundo donax TaxID=35708 RepID=A0A0A8Z3I1_ARUDO